MKKKDIKKVLFAYDNINNLSILVSYTKTNGFSSIYDKDEKLWLPFLEGFEEEMDILKDEIREARASYDKALEDKKMCSHDIRIETVEDDGGFCLSPTHRCALCGAVVNTNYSWYLSDGRNNYTVTVKNKNQFDGDYWYIYDKGLDRGEVINYVMSFLDKYEDDDEVDLVEEFSLLDLQKDITVNKKKRILNDYVLIIGGTNKERLYDDIYISKAVNDESYNFLDYFGNLFNTKVALFDREEVLSKDKFDKYRKCRWILFKDYDSLFSLEKELTNFRDIDFGVILDLSDLYDYSYQDNCLTTLKYDLDLKSIFPNSKIVKIDNFSKNELLELKSEFDVFYQKMDNEYYASFGKTSFECICDEAKQLIKKTI